MVVRPVSLFIYQDRLLQRDDGRGFGGGEDAEHTPSLQGAAVGPHRYRPDREAHLQGLTQAGFTQKARLGQEPAVQAVKRSPTLARISPALHLF